MFIVGGGEAGHVDGGGWGVVRVGERIQTGNGQLACNIKNRLLWA